MEDRLKELMQELGNAINGSLSDSDRIAAVTAEIKRAGYDVFGRWRQPSASISLKRPTNRQEPQPRPKLSRQELASNCTNKLTL